MLTFSRPSKKYTIPNRLTDVIRLIAVLSSHYNAFKTENGTKESLRGEPLSVNSKLWTDIAIKHPEFFRLNESGKNFALVIRSYYPEKPSDKKPEQKIRDPLTMQETQAMINFAVNLYDKEVEARKVNGIWIPVIVAIIVLIGQFINITYTNNTGAETNKNLRQLKEQVKDIEQKLGSNR